MSPTTKKKKIIAPAARKFSPREIKSIEVKSDKPVLPPNPSLRLYRRIAGGFIAVVVVLLATVILLSTTKATILVTPQPRSVDVSLLVDVVKEGTAEGKILGTVAEQTFEQTKIFPVVGTEQKEVLDKAGGMVKIINTSSRNQPLVATTRLLSSGGVLFRLDSGVMVPAGGSVETTVHADQVGATGDIAPDKFTIPGLSTSLQSSIYAESSVAMTGGRKMVSVVTQQEIDDDIDIAFTELYDLAKDQLRTSGKGTWVSEVFSSEILTKESDAQPGEEKDSVTISLKMKVVGVFFNINSINSLVEAKLYESLEDGFVFSETTSGQNNVILEIVNSDAEKNSAELRATSKKDSIVSNTSPFLQPEVLIGKTPVEVKDYLVSAGVASDVQVKIFPPWSQKVPSLIDHVVIEVEN